MNYVAFAEVLKAEGITIGGGKRNLLVGFTIGEVCSNYTHSLVISGAVLTDTGLTVRFTMSQSAACSDTSRSVPARRNARSNFPH